MHKSNCRGASPPLLNQASTPFAPDSLVDLCAGTEKPYFVEVHGGFLYWTKCKPDGESRSGHTRVVVLSGADVAGDPEGVRVTFPVPDGSRRSSLGAATNMATDIIAVTGATMMSEMSARRPPIRYCSAARRNYAYQ